MRTKKLIVILLPMLLVSLNFSCKKTVDEDVIIEPTSAPIVTSAIGSDIIVSAKKMYGDQTTLRIRTEIAKERKQLKPVEILTPTWNKAVRYPQPQGHTILVIPTKEFTLDNKKVGFLRKFIFIERDGKVTQSRIVEIYGDPDYLKQHKDDLFTKYNLEQIQNFNGSIITYDMNYRYLRGVVFKDGQRQNAGARVKSIQRAPLGKVGMMTGSDIQCYDRYEVVTYSDGHQEWVFLYTWCTEGGSSSGGSSSGGSSSGGSGPGGGGEDPTNPESFGFPANPYNGLSYTYYYPNGKSIVFTYDSSMQAWLLPELQVFKDQGYTLVGPSNMNKKIVSAVSLALAEPTPIGEILVLGFITYHVVAYAYENISAFLSEREQLHNYCLSFYLQCQGSGNPCATCQQFCLVQGDWDWNNCPIGRQ